MTTKEYNRCLELIEFEKKFKEKNRSRSFYLSYEVYISGEDQEVWKYFYSLEDIKLALEDYKNIKRIDNFYFTFFDNKQEYYIYYNQKSEWKSYENMLKYL